MPHNWHYTKESKKYGPITAAVLKELVKTGQLFPDDLVWREDMKDWIKAGAVKGLFRSSIVQPQTKLSPPPLPQTMNQSNGSTLLTPKRLLLAFVMFTLLIAILLPIVKRARDSARLSYAEHQRENQETGQADEGETNSKKDLFSNKPVEVGTLEEMGEAAFENLRFADVEESPDIEPIALTEDFAKAGSFRFRTISPDLLMASMTAEDVRVLKYKERTVIREMTESFDIGEGTGNPKSMIERHPDNTVPLFFPIIQVGAIPGDQWECVNFDISGNSMITRFHYRRCVEHQGLNCAMIERGLVSSDGKQLTKTIEWYAERIGLVKRLEHVRSHDLGLGWQLLVTYHRITED